jgi:hypothetical protein
MTTHYSGSTSVSDLCAKIKNMGYAASKRVKLYGEEYEIVSDPFLEDQEIVVQAKTKKNPVVRMVRLPSTVLPSVRGRKSQSAA